MIICFSDGKTQQREYTENLSEVGFFQEISNLDRPVEGHQTALFGLKHLSFLAPIPSPLPPDYSGHNQVGILNPMSSIAS